MKNFVQRGVDMNYANSSGSDIQSGDIVPLAGGIGVAAVLIPATTGVGAVVTEGVFQLPKATGEAWNQGDKLFYNSGTNKITKTSGANVFAGIAWEDQLSADALGLVKLINCGQGDSSGLSVAAFVATVTTANATDLATSEALANQLKTTVNAIQASLIAAGLMASS